MRLFRPVETTVKELPWIASEQLAEWFDPAAAEFYRRLTAGGYEPDALVNVLPRHKLLYIVVPKAASTRIRTTLAMVDGRRMRTLKPSRRSKYRGPYGPRSMTVGAFFRLATAPETLRFSFVRNPYARVVSCWADKFAGKPLVAGHHPVIDAYLSLRRAIDPRLPAGPGCTLQFSEFVTFAASTAKARHDIHLQAQCDILSMPGIALDHTGKVESFDHDFAPVLDHLGVGDDICRDACRVLNASDHDDWRGYYTRELAERVYRAYECDFDRFGYARLASLERARARVSA
jgi:hypothetical protein